MEAHYFDIETYSPNDKPDPKTDQIISIQFQKFDLKTGNPLGKLYILKSWEESEEEILKFIHKWFFTRNPWKFIPVGFNLQFEWKFLEEKFKTYGIDTKDISAFLDYPQIDLKVFAILKQGSFHGASLSLISNKEENGNVIKELYENKDYHKLVSYITQEAESFLELYKTIRDNVDDLI